MSVKEGLELEQMLIAIQVLQQDLASTERPATLWTAIANDGCEQIDFSQCAKALAKGWGFDTIAAGSRWIEIDFPSCWMWMASH